ncbi:MAG: DUF2167 domain-containing protein [Alphaproteobacteria bacterium]
MKGIPVLTFAAAMLAAGWAQDAAGSPRSAATEEPAAQPPASGAALPVEAGWPEGARAFVASLKPRTGEVKIDAASVTLNVPENFYFLPAQDARKVLEQAWSNPPDESVLGMLFPAGTSPLHDNVWGVTISFQQDGYVKDDDAGSIDYDALLERMREDAAEENKLRKEQGYPTVELLGWAARPHYDENTHKLYWAKELRFEGDPANTVNYDIRALGRKGVLVLGFVAGMEELPEIEANLPAVLNMVSFDDGARYEDFDPGVDQVAAYGIGGLIAGKVLAKTGFFAAALVFLKKFGVLLVAALVGAFAWFRRRIFGSAKSTGES